MSTTLLLLALFALQPGANGEQFVLFDVTFDYTKADADNSKPSKSHYYVKGDKLNPNRPTDWTSPVDYRNGTVHVRAEVLEKAPGGEKTTWTLCYIPNKGQGQRVWLHRDGDVYGAWSLRSRRADDVLVAKRSHCVDRGH